MAYPPKRKALAVIVLVVSVTTALAIAYEAILPFSSVPVSHYKAADLSVAYGTLTLLTGIFLIVPRYFRGIKGEYVRYLRLIHVILGIITSFFGILTYLIVPGL